MKHKITLVICLFIISSTSIYSQNNTENLNCFTIAVGKNASESKEVLIAHNEDDWGNLTINIYKVPAKDYTNKNEITLLNKTKIKQVKHTFSFLWIETTEQKFGDYYVNENGVSICSNQCLSKEDTAVGNIGFYLRRIIAERAKSAKEGVKIAGELVSSIGYETSGRTYCIADKNEIWMLSIVKGHHWIAQRVPDDSIAIIPNYYTIEEINLNDTSNFLGSNNIIDYAISRNWYKPKTDGEFNFRLAYGSNSSLNSIGNIPRHWSATNYLAKNEYNYGEHIPFAFTAKNPVTIEKLQKILSSHYEGSDFENHPNLRKNPHKNIVNRICNAGTKFSTITQFSEKTIVWWAPLNPCIHPFIPIVFDIKNIPEVYQNKPLKDAIEYHFDKNRNRIDASRETAYSYFYKLNKKIDFNYAENITITKKWKNEIETNSKEEIYKAIKENPEEVGNISEKLMIELYQKELKILKN
jgi:dipeptidase